MAIPFNPDDVTSGFNLTKINSNFNKTKTALADALSRSGEGPNQMEADIDMNSNDLLNVKTLQAEDISIDGGNVTGILERAETAAQEAEQSAAEAAASAASVPAEVGKKIIEFDVRMSQFAGGAPINGVDDDQPALQAALDYAKTLGGRYTGGTARIRIPRGILRIGNTATVTGCTNVSVVGEGDGSTTLKGLGNYPIINGNDPILLPLSRFRIEDLTIEGPGNANTLAHGIRLGPNNNCFIDARVWACRRGISLANSWQTTLNNIRIDGQGSLACQDGIYLEDGDASVVENAVLILGGLVQGVTRYGFRGESVTGSKVFGLEVLGCGSTGVYFGESPTGKDLKWFSWVGGLIDTCPNLLVVKKGTSTLAELLHFSGLWLGYANGNPGVGVDIQGMKKTTVSADMVANTVFAANVQNCEKVSINFDTIVDYDRLATGSVAIICNSTTKSRFHVGTTSKLAASGTTTSFIEQGSANFNYVTGVFDKAVTLIGANSLFNGIQNVS